MLHYPIVLEPLAKEPDDNGLEISVVRFGITEGFDVPCVHVKLKPSDLLLEPALVEDVPDFFHKGGDSEAVGGGTSVKDEVVDGLRLV